MGRGGHDPIAIAQRVDGATCFRMTFVGASAIRRRIQIREPDRRVFILSGMRVGIFRRKPLQSESRRHEILFFAAAGVVICFVAAVAIFACQSMSRKSGSRFSEKDMRQNKNLEHIPIRLNRDVL